MSNEKKKYSKIEPSKDLIDIDKAEDQDEERESLEKIVSAAPKKVKKGLMSRFVSGVVGPDGVSGIGEYVNDEIIKPAIKNIIVDAVTSGINMIMYGDRGAYRGPYRPSGSYRGRDHQPNRIDYSTRREPEREPRNSKRSRSPRYGMDEYKIDDRYEASHVLTVLTEHADRYGSVTIAEYYDLIGVEPAFSDYEYGWTIQMIARATIVSARGGFVIKFPPPEAI